MCPHSFALERLYPGEDGEEARLGTAAHFYATEAVQGRFWPVGHVTPNGVPLDAEMIEAGAHFIAAAADIGLPLHVERHVTMHATLHPECEGTPDAYAVDHATHTLWILDYKYGHREVDPYLNAQLSAYFAGICEAEGLTRDMVKGWQVHFIIVQPRNYRGSGPVRRWSTLGYVAMHEVDRLQEAAYRAKDPEAHAVTGDHCRDCTGRHACEPLRRVGNHVLDIAGANIPHELPNEALALQLRLIKRGMARLEALKLGLEGQAMARIRAGQRVPGWAIEQGKGREKWTRPVAEVLALGELMGVNLAKPQEAITPNQARTAGVDASVIKAYSVEPNGENKLVISDDSAAAKAFG